MNPVFSIKNFRSFGEEGADFELAPITVLTGCNSAGKSSLVKALLLLAKQSEKIPSETTAQYFFENTQTPLLRKKDVLEVAHPDFTLGRFENVLHNNATDTVEMSYIVHSRYLKENVRVSKVFKVQEKDIVGNARCVSYRIEAEDSSTTYYSEWENDGVYDSYTNEKALSEKLQQFEESYKQYRNDNDVEDLEEDECRITKFPLIPNDLEEQVRAWDILQKVLIDRELSKNKEKVGNDWIEKLRRARIGGNKKEEIEKVIGEVSEDATYGEVFDKIIQKYPHKSWDYEILKDFISAIPQSLAELLSPLNVFAFLVYAEVEYPRFLRGTCYINSDSVKVSRFYSIYGEDKMSAALRDRYEKHLNQNQTGWDEEEETYIDKWIKRFGIGDKVVIERVNVDSVITLNLKTGDKKRQLADEGYGISRLVSFLFNIENHIPLNPDGPGGTYLPKYICVEEPEAHLHPKFQSMLAKVFVEAYKTYNIRFIIETHSEYLIRKLQLMVAGKERGLTAKEVSVNYIEKNDEGSASNRKIDILEDGRLSEPFGPGFFDEASGLSMHLLKMKIDSK